MKLKHVLEFTVLHYVPKKMFLTDRPGRSPANLTSALDEGKWSASRLGRFTPRERAPGNLWIGGWVGPRAVLDAKVKFKFWSFGVRYDSAADSASIFRVEWMAPETEHWGSVTTPKTTAWIFTAVKTPGLAKILQTSTLVEWKNLSLSIFRLYQSILKILAKLLRTRTLLYISFEYFNFLAWFRRLRNSNWFRVLKDLGSICKVN